MEKSCENGHGRYSVKTLFPNAVKSLLHASLRFSRSEMACWPMSQMNTRCYDRMKIIYYMPFKPLGHRNPSGDLVIGTELFDFLQKNSVEIQLASRFRCRWIYLKPHLWPKLLLELARVYRLCRKERPEVWLTYHSYYKAPDLIGPLCCRLLNIPYVIFQGIYSTKRRKRIKTWAGFYLNRMALRRAVCIFSNKRPDFKNLQRLFPAGRLMYIAPGLHPCEFTHDGAARKRIRSQLNAEDRVVVITAAMFRPGVKTRGLLQVIESCGRLVAKGYDPLLFIAGDGTEREKIVQAATDALGDRAVFLGRLARQTMKDYYSAADIFAFPGIEESLGMVFLEAQACELPVVACSDWGASEAVIDGETGLLSKAPEKHLFDAHLEQLAGDEDLRRKMGEAAARHVRQSHDIEVNYRVVLDHLQEIAAKNDEREIVDLK